MLRKLYPVIFLFLVIFLIDGFDTYAQNPYKRRQREMRNKSRKIANFTGKAQRFDNRKQYNGLGLNISSMNYFGDLTPQAKILSTDLRFARPQIGLNYSRRIGTRYTIRGSFAWGRLSGDDYTSQKPEGEAKFRYTRNLHFRNDIKELSVVAIVDLYENRGNYLRRVGITPYVFGGLAGFYHNPKALGPIGTDDEDKWVALRPLKTEGKSYSPIQLSIPAGVGVRARLSDDFDISLEIGYRYTFTDYLDDVSGNYADPASLSSDQARYFADRTTEPIAARVNKERDPVWQTLTGVDANGNGTNRFSAAGQKRGSKNKDIYIVTGIHITYVFHGKGIFGGRSNAKFR
jgi:hypothetical protein